MKKSEQDIQSKIRLALSPYGMVFRTNSGEFWQGKERYFPELKQTVLTNLYRVKGLPKGFSDLLFVGFDGKVAFIEVKKPGEVQKKEQINFMNQMRKYGYKAGVAKSVEDAIKIVKGE